MPLREFSRLTSRLLAHLGEEAIFHGVQQKINIEHGVSFADASDQTMYERSVATIDKVLRPAKADSIELVDGGAYFVLDALLKDNGYSQQWILLGTPKP